MSDSASPCILIGWMDTEQMIFLVTFLPGWTWAEFDRIVQPISDALRAVEHPVLVMADLHTAPVAPSLDIVPHLRDALAHRPPNVPFRIVVVFPERGGWAEVITRSFFLASDVARAFTAVYSMAEAEHIAAQWKAEQLSSGEQMG